MLIGLAACSRPPARPFERVAILAFDNLSGDSKLDWVSQAAAKILAIQLTGAPHTVPVLATTVSDGYLAGATRLVHGYFSNSETFHVSIEDTATHSMVVDETVTLGLLPALDRIAHRIDPDTAAFSTTKPESAEAWGTGDFEKAVQNDPAFGTAWLSWAQQLEARRDLPGALGVVERALAANPPIQNKIDRSRIELLGARLRNDTGGIAKALEALAGFSPHDVPLLRNLAAAQMQARSFSKAAETYAKVQEKDPQDAQSVNLRGYAEGFAGDLEKAVRTFSEYGAKYNQRVNSLDSLGEVYFANGKFPEAEKAFLDAFKADPNFLDGVEQAKAAYARWFAGSQEGADQLMREFLIGRAKKKDPLSAWREAVWLYSTGRESQARITVRNALEEDNPKDAADLMKKQADVWKNPQQMPVDPAVLKKLYDQTPPAQDGLVRAFYAAALLEKGSKDEARKLVTRWPIPEAGGDPLFQGFLIPKFLEVRKAVGL